MPAKWQSLNHKIIACRRCPRLRKYCADVAREKRRAFRDWEYWGRPVPNFGDRGASLLIVGLAPAAHGANRTGRMFTGDRSGEWLYRALHRAGFASHPVSTSADDRMELFDCAITAVCHCAPPGNKPTGDELANCHPWLAQTMDQLPLRVLLALGQLAWSQVVRECLSRGWCTPPRPRFGHGATYELADRRWLLGSYHPSQQNTFTGRLTESMFDQIFTSARKLLAS